MAKGIVKGGLNDNTGGDTSDATAVAADIVSGKTAYVATGKVSGTLVADSPYKVIIANIFTQEYDGAWVTVVAI